MFREALIHKEVNRRFLKADKEIPVQLKMFREVHLQKTQLQQKVQAHLQETTPHPEVEEGKNIKVSFGWLVETLLKVETLERGFLFLLNYLFKRKILLIKAVISFEIFPI
jgi:hypothetical protein